MSLFGVRSASGELFTLNGLLLVHENREEIEWLLPGYLAVDVTNTELPTLAWADHPGIKGAGITFPLDKNDFR